MIATFALLVWVITSTSNSDFQEREFDCNREKRKSQDYLSKCKHLEGLSKVELETKCKETSYLCCHHCFCDFVDATICLVHYRPFMDNCPLEACCGTGEAEHCDQQAYRERCPHKCCTEGDTAGYCVAVKDAPFVCNNPKRYPDVSASCCQTCACAFADEQKCMKNPWYQENCRKQCCTEAQQMCIDDPTYKEHCLKKQCCTEDEKDKDYCDFARQFPKVCSDPLHEHFQKVCCKTCENITVS